MTPARVRIGLGAFLLLGVGVAGNLLLLQPPAVRDVAGMRGERRSLSTGSLNQAKDEPGIETASPSQTIRAVQRELNLRGYDVGTPDGKRGLVTQAGIMAFEFDHGMALTGEASEALLKEILLGGSQPERRPRSSVESSASAEEVVRKVQQQLAAAGYQVGKATGRLDDDTLRAIREFESDQRLPETGRISGQLVARLTLQGKKKH